MLSNHDILGLYSSKVLTIGNIADPEAAYI